MSGAMRKSLAVGILASSTMLFASTGFTGNQQQQGAGATGGAVQGQHSMKAKVKDVDAKTGVVDVDTEVGDLKLHFPPQAASKLKKGEEIQVQLSYQPITAKGAGAAGGSNP